MKYTSKASSVRHLTRLFSATNTTTLDEAFFAYGRNPENRSANRAWFANLLVHLRHHNLVQAVYSRRNHRRVLVGVALTTEGMAALGRIASDVPVNAENTVDERALTTPDLSEILHRIVQLRQEHPEYAIEFGVALKSELSLSPNEPSTESLVSV